MIVKSKLITKLELFDRIIAEAHLYLVVDNEKKLLSYL